MGKKRSTNLRKIAKTLIQTYPEDFTGDFELNKKIINDMTDFSKVIRNKVAGHITKMKK